MFERKKLRKYSDQIIGFAFERDFCNINTYLVLQNSYGIKFITYYHFSLTNKSNADDLIILLKNIIQVKLYHIVIEDGHKVICIIY